MQGGLGAEQMGKLFFLIGKNAAGGRDDCDARKTSAANGANPAASAWTSGSVPYTSKAVYYKIKDIRTVNW